MRLTPRLDDLLKAWAHAPWHSWFKDAPQWRDLFAECFSRVPTPELEKLLRQNSPLVVLPPVTMSRVVRVPLPLREGAWIMQLDSALLGRPYHEALAIVAHELAHILVTPTPDALSNDLAADECVARWGLGAELKAALERNLDGAHPRIEAARRYLRSPRAA